VDIFNRVIIVVLAAVWVILMAVVILLAWTADTETINRLADFVNYLDDHTDNPSKLILTLGASALIVLSLIIIIAELAPEPGTGDVRLEGVAGATAVLPAEAICQRIEHELMALPEIQEARASVTARDKGLAVALGLTLTPDANVALTTEEACHRTQETIEQRIGVALVGLPTVQIAFGPDEGEAGPPAPEPPPPPAAEETPPPPAAEEPPPEVPP
jgi:hypothetical protein